MGLAMFIAGKPRVPGTLLTLAEHYSARHMPLRLGCCCDPA